MQVFYANIHLMYAREQSTENKEEAQNKEDVLRSNALTAAQVAPVRMSKGGSRSCSWVLLDLGYWISKSK